jgi:hypothetical protein
VVPGPPATQDNRIRVAAAVADLMAEKEESTTLVPVFHTTTANRGNNSLELRGGSGPHEGNVYINGFPVCEDDSRNRNQWHKEEAGVVCRMFGYAGASAAYPNCRFGDCTDDWQLAGVDCVGDEANILDCKFEAPSSGCNKGSEGVGVTCLVA